MARTNDLYRTLNTALAMHSRACFLLKNNNNFNMSHFNSIIIVRILSSSICWRVLVCVFLIDEPIKIFTLNLHDMTMHMCICDSVNLDGN